MHSGNTASPYHLNANMCCFEYIHHINTGMLSADNPIIPSNMNEIFSHLVWGPTTGTVGIYSIPLGLQDAGG